MSREGGVTLARGMAEEKWFDFVVVKGEKESERQILFDEESI